MSPRTGFPEVSEAVKLRTKLYVHLHETTSVPEIPNSGLKPHGAAANTETPASHLVGAGTARPRPQTSTGARGQLRWLGGISAVETEKLSDVEGRPQE